MLVATVLAHISYVDYFDRAVVTAASFAFWAVES
jgi:hypothetical protein